MKAKLFSFLLALVASVNMLYAESGTCGENLTWDLTSGVLTISGTGQMDDYSSMTDVPWYNLFSLGFYGIGISQIVINDGVTSIGNHVFSGCRAVTSVEIPNSVTSIGDGAFAGCSGLTSVTIGNSVTSIGENAFYECGFHSISIPNSVTSIGSRAFEYCTNLTSIEIPNSATSIGDYTFYSCINLASVTIGNRVTSIGYGTFYGCKSLTSITIPNSVISIGESAFYSCKGLTSVTIGNGVTSIGEQAFYSCSVLSSLTLGNSVNSIGYMSFSYCKSLTSVTIPNSVTNIGNNAFIGCKSLSSIIIPNSVISIGDGAFSYCTALTSLPIPNSVTSIGKEVFKGCTGLTSVTIPNNVTSIGEYAFSGCTSLISVEIPSSVTSIGEYAFSSCTSLISVEIPMSVTSIGSYAFRYCSNLASVTIPGSVASIGWGAFSDCSNLTDIYVACEDTERIKQLLRNDSRVTNPPVPYTITAYADHGSVTTNIDEVTMCDFVTCSVNSDYGYHFDHWSDDNTDNPRMVLLTQDTTFIAEFAFDKSGTCGENNALTWSYDDQSNTLTINGNGALTENYTFGVEATKVMNTLVIGDGVTAIGDSAFYGIRTLIHLFIGANVATIGDYAFAECRNIDDITSYSILVPTINATTFANIGNKQYIYLYVPVNRERSYKRDEFWGEFDIQIKEAETTTTDGDVVVVPTDNTAEISWPTVADADTYEIEITKDGVVVCVLKFNTNGQLVGIAFAPGRNGTNYTQQVQTAGFKFTVTGLTSGTRYGYTVAAKDALEQTVDAKSGTFTTTIEGVTMDIDQVIVPNSDQITNDPLQTTTKLLRNGQILILRGDKTYNLTGQEVK